MLVLAARSGSLDLVLYLLSFKEIDLDSDSNAPIIIVNAAIGHEKMKDKIRDVALNLSSYYIGLHHLSPSLLKTVHGWLMKAKCSKRSLKWRS